MRKIILLLTLSLSVLSQPMAEITHRFQGEMDRPTDIAVLNDGRICVADGVNNQVLVFKRDGSYVTLTFPQMKRPLGLAADFNGGLLITDTQADAIFILDKYLTLKIHIPLSQEVDATDVLAMDQEVLWVVDNDGHQIIVMDRQGHIKQRLGSKGSTGPAFNYPSTIAGNSNNQIFICDVLNGRIQLYDSEGIYRGQIADWGITPGSLFRPKGVAANQSGAFVVTDSFTGTIHYFRTQSSVGSVLPLKFKNPLGVAWDNEGILWVVESGTGNILGIKVQ